MEYNCNKLYILYRILLFLFPRYIKITHFKLCIHVIIFKQSEPSIMWRGIVGMQRPSLERVVNIRALIQCFHLLFFFFFFRPWRF